MKSPVLFLASALLTLAAIGASQDHGIRSVIGNVFLQDTSPGTPQIGHAAIKGTFRAGQVFASSPSTIIPIVGNNMSFDDGAIGGSFTSAAQHGIALRATATNTGLGGVGLSGESRSSTGIGVSGQSKSTGVLGVTDGTSATGAGVWGKSNSATVPGLFGENTQSDGFAAKFVGHVQVSGGRLQTAYPNGVLGFYVQPFSNGVDVNVGAPTSAPTLVLQSASGGAFNGMSLHDAIGFTRATVEVNSQNQGVVTAAIKNFVEPNPNNPKEDIVYACVEGPEAAMYTRGTARLSNGRSHVAFPSHFSALAAKEGVTIILSPGSGTSRGVAWEHKTSSGFDIVELAGGRGSYDVDWEVKAVRAGFEDYKVVRPWTDRLDPKVDREQAFAARLQQMRQTRRP